MTKAIIVLLIFLHSSIVYSSEASDDVKTVYDILEKKETDEYYKNRLKNNEIDFLKTVAINNNTYKIISLGYGSIGNTYIISLRNNSVYKTENLISDVYTKNEIDGLSDDELLLISTTSGTGVRDYFAILVKFDTDGIIPILTIPINGYDDSTMLLPDQLNNGDSSLIYKYRMNSFYCSHTDCKITFSFSNDFVNVPSNIQEEILKDNNMKQKEEKFAIEINDVRKLKITGSKAAQDHLKFILDLYKKLKFYQI